MLNDFISLIFPTTCAACAKPLYKSEKNICLSCVVKLPKTNYHLDKDNPVSRLFWGRIDLYSASSYCFFSKGSKIQRLMHRLKYKGHKEIGEEVGKLYGLELIKSPLFNTVDHVLPVPLHPKKFKIRGFNQSDLIADGIAAGMESTSVKDNLIRKIANPTQTKKSMYQRWENVADIFDLRMPEQFAGKHLLIVDDVITTGSTIEACAHAVQKAPDVKVSIATLACALRNDFG